MAGDDENESAGAGAPTAGQAPFSNTQVPLPPKLSIE